jgi:hypothetical protein
MAQLLWPEGFDQRAEVEAGWRGYLSHARVRLDDGRVFSVYFAEPGRLKQDIEEAQPSIVAEIGLIVLPEITRHTMEAAVAYLAPRGFFEYFRPLEDSDRPWEV